MGRSRTIRAKIIGLLLVPIMSMLILWGVIAAVMANDSLELRQYKILWTNLRLPAYELLDELQRERLAAVRLLRGGRQPQVTAFLSQRLQTDKAREGFLRLSARSADASPAIQEQVRAVHTQLARLEAIRAEVDARVVDRFATIEHYDAIADALFGLHRRVALIDDIPIYEQSRLVINLGYAKELLTREQAIAAGATTEAERTAFTQIVGNRRYLIDMSLGDLDPRLRAIQVGIISSPAYQRLRIMEEQIAAGRTPAGWAATSQELVRQFDEAEMDASAMLAEQAEPVADAVIVRAAVLGGLALVLVIVSIVISLRQAARLSRELAELRQAALEVARERLPQVVARLRDGAEVGAEVEVPDIEVRSSTVEIEDVGRAFAAVQSTAVEAAVGQAQLREGFRQVFRNLARRSQSLLHRQRIQLESMQHRATEPGTLDDLFRLDHLTTRMRRHAEGLIILSGAAPGRAWSKPVPLIDVVRGAAAEVEDYTRVSVEPMPGLSLKGPVVADVIHLIAELIENATVFSPPHTMVTVRGEQAARGFAVVVEDRGLGMSEAELSEFNDRLASMPEFDALNSDRLGLFVVARLAARHHIRVTLRGSPYGGTTAIVLIPAEHVITPTPADPVKVRELDGVND
ncbi:nitrate- and nitrite sensing domain-containing protein [Thermoactinospora rubra]|uniref:sensor histidine kinase n=1 Tax=Thermoactinospora rubra TaxID=1088767 RepID=UPI000A10A15E|nr:nitrate- and nitrite sensing domain-containing protein [Thermoactinospora rubra]